MAVKVANKLTLSPQFLAKALVAKTTPQYAKQDKYGGFSYEKDIYPQARTLFKDLYPTHLYNNEEFTRRFIRDFYRKDPQLLEVISRQTLTGQPGEVLAGEQPMPAGEVAGTMTGGTPLPSAPSAPVFHPIPQTLPAGSRFQSPKVPASFTSGFKNFGSKLGIFFQRNVGKFLTVDNIATVVSGGIGMLVGRGLTGGSAFGTLMGGVGGVAGRFWIGGGGGGQFLGRMGNGIVNIGANISNQVSSSSLIRGPSKKLAWALIGAFFLFFILGAVAGIPTSGPPGEATPISLSVNGPSVDLAQCSFAGASGNLKIGNPSLADMVSDISAKVGVPGSVVMGILRIESVPAFTNKDPNYLANDYDAVVSSAGAIGISQFLPSTFSGVFLSNKDGIFQKFQKAAVSTTIESPTIPPPNDNVMRITSIRDSIIMAAYFIKEKKNAGVGSTTPWDENAARIVAGKYYGTCSYEGATGSYCDDLAQSFTNCKSPSAYLADIGQIRQIVSGIQNNCSYKTSDKEIAGVVSAANLSCLNSISPPLPDLVDKHIRSNTVAYFFLQCIGYVKALASWIDNETLNDHSVANAYDYEAIPPVGYSFVPKTDNNDIILGDIAIWDNAPNGHVAYVVGVESKNRFLVTEASWGSQGYVRIDRTIDKLSEPGFRGWARRK